MNSSEGLVDTAVLQATGGRSARSVSQASTSAVHLASCQPVPQAPLTVPENSFMASLQQEASGALGVHYSASHSGSKARAVNARLEEEFADLLSQDKYCFDSEYEQCLSSRGFEYKQGSAPIVYKDRLRSKVEFWVSIGSSPWGLYIIRFGYRIPFISLPPRGSFCNNRSASDHASFVDRTISDLLLVGSVTEVFTPPTVVNPLTVSVNSVGRCRLILDLRHVNKFIPKVKFKMEDSRTFHNYVHSPGYMFKFDMKSWYHHVSIHQESQTFLGFQWPLGSSKAQVFCFRRRAPVRSLVGALRVHKGF